MLFKNKSFEKTDTYILIICFICIFCSSAWLSYDLLFNSPQTRGQQPIGKITQIKNHVKRKFNRSLVWYDANQKETVYEKDWVFTGSDSQTKIVFDDGGELTLEPDSLIILTRASGALNINLQHGSMLADISSDIKVNILKNGELHKISADDTKNRISTFERSSQAWVVKNVQADILLKKPLDSSTLWLLENQEATLEWETNSNIKNFKVEFSKNRDFNEPFSKVYNKKIAQLKPPMFGEVFWRVSDNNNSSSISAINSFNIRVNTPPKPDLDLAAGEALELIKKGEEIPAAELPWRDQYNSWDSYDIQVSKFSDFSTIMAEDSTSKRLYLFDPKKEGLYHWRVRGQNKNGSIISEWSPPQSTNIVIKDGFKEEIFLSKKNIFLTLEATDLKKISDDKMVSKKFYIKWSTNFKAKDYKVQISRKNNFKNLQENSTSTEKKQLFKQASVGVSYYRIITKGKNGNKNIVSKTGRITTYFPAPQNLSNEITDSNHMLRWEKVPGVEKYQIRYKDSKKGSPKYAFATSNEKMITNSNPFMEWRVRAVDKITKSPISDYSKTHLTELPDKTLASVPPQRPDTFPVITSPAKRKTFVSIGDTPIFFVLKWEFENKADYYKVEISKTPNMDQVIFRKEIRKKKRAVVNEVFPPGKYYMRVLSFRKGFSKSWSDTEVFRVKKPD